MERQRMEADLIHRAAEGDAGAAGAILDALAAGDPKDKLELQRKLLELQETMFWSRVLEFMATGKWNGIDIDRGRAQAVRTRIICLFASESGAAGAREEALREAISGPNREVSETAMEVAKEVQADGAVDALLEAMKKGSPDQRLQAIRTLGLLRQARAVPALLAVLGGSDETAAGLAKDALAEIGGPAVEPLAKAWDDLAERGQARWMAARALARIHDSRAIPTLVRHLSDPEYELRWLAANGLILQKGEGLRATLVALATQYLTSGMADAAAHVLQCVQDARIKPVLKPVVDALRSVDFRWAASEPAHDALEQLAKQGLI